MFTIKTYMYIYSKYLWIILWQKLHNCGRIYKSGLYYSLRSVLKLDYIHNNTNFLVDKTSFTRYYKRNKYTKKSMKRVGVYQL